MQICERIEILKNIWQILQMRKWKRIAATGFLCVAVFAAVLGGRPEGFLRTKTEMPTVDTGMTETSVEGVETEKMHEALPVSEEDAELLGQLYRAMKHYDFSSTATILNENEKAFDTLMTDVLAGEKYYYLEDEKEDGTIVRKMSRVLSTDAFIGMVLTRYNTVFYGEFSDGKPNGNGFTIQAMVLDQPRYSYAEGVWENGKLNGEGRVGYHYYLDVPASGLVRTEKRGKYRENLLDGVFVYETESALGEKLSWEMKAVNGVTVITQDWEYFPYRKEYMLGAVEDTGRAYVLPRDKVATVLWNNMIVWPE